MLCRSKKSVDTPEIGGIIPSLTVLKIMRTGKHCDTMLSGNKSKNMEYSNFSVFLPDFRLCRICKQFYGKYLKKHLATA